MISLIQPSPGKPNGLTALSRPLPGFLPGLAKVRFGSEEFAAGHESDGSSHHPLTPGEMDQAVDLFRRAVKQAETAPGSDSPWTPLESLMAQLLNGSSSTGRKLVNALQNAMSGKLAEHSCTQETYLENNSPRVGYRVKSGMFNKVFTKRTLLSESSLPFDAFLEKKFGQNKRVIISMTGWTKPPVEPLLQNDYYRSQMERMPTAKWPKYAETVYVNIIKRYLSDVIESLKEEEPDFNPATDLGILYGVTPEGVDRAVQEFCQKKSIPIVGLTCFDWAEYVPDEAGLPEVYVANTPGDFGRLMADSSNKIVVTGGRGFAANVKINGDKAKGSERRIPVDLFKSYAGVEVPPVVAGDDEVTAKIVNAAALAKSLGQNPWNFEVVERAKNGRTTDNEEVFATVHILKKELEKLFQIRSLASEQVASD
ncbi:MAG: hypothetical protein K2X66_04345 [Cyanobacteria bacterium]|nr:hypothetical protein [Cyanobacteriota bacterium]